jgi:biotin carboxyl carrier protein
MKFSITIRGQEHTLEIVRADGLTFRFDGTEFPAEVAEVQAGVYSVLLRGRSFQVRVEPGGPDQVENGVSTPYSVQVDGASYAVSIRDPRRWSRDRNRVALAGKQNVSAPMPGKVVRVLVQEGQPVEAGQGLLVVEAMKMQNEIKSAKAGSVQKVLVQEGQPVNAGETLLVVD